MNRLPFTTTDEERVKLETYIAEMYKLQHGLPSQFVNGVYERALECQGTFELVQLWYEYPSERGVIESDLRDVLK